MSLLDSGLFGAVGKLLGGGGHVPVPAYTPASSSANIDLAQLLRDRPDVLAEYQQESTRDAKSKQHLQELGINSAEQFARMWYDNNAARDGYTQTPVAAPTPTAPTSPTTPTVTPTPEQDTLTSTVNQLLGLFNQQQQKAQQQDAARENARASVASALGTTTDKLNSSLYGNSITDILSSQYEKAKTQLDRGLSRGMFNDVGYNAGLASLDKNKATASASLNKTANDLLSGYRKQYDDIRTEALNAANNFGGIGNFDLTDYTTRANDILNSAKNNLPGNLLASAGNGLFDLSAIRGDAGTAQGATNLRNMDVIEALSKRKQAEGVGRGLGSQGTF